MNDASYEQMGIAAMLVGMRRAREILDREIETMESHLGNLRGAPPLQKNGKAQRSAGMSRGNGVRPAQQASAKPAKGRRKATSDYWARMTAEERSVEMKRRRALAKRNRTPSGTLRGAA